MDDGMKMNLRAHRQRNYTVTESQHPEEFGYARGNYSKEYVSPAFELNSAAKLMTKYINTINKQVREKIKNDELTEKAAYQQNAMLGQKNQQMEAIINNGPRKINGPRKDPKDENAKKDKQKRNIPQQGPSKDLKTQDGIEKNKGTKNNTQTPSLSLNPNDQHLYRVLAQLGTTGRGINPAFHMQAVNKAILQQQSYVNNSQFFREKQKNPAQQPQPRNISRSKLFRRSSYHVAIAYNIHLKKIYESGNQINQIMLDPTHPAKKLRTQKEKPAQQ